MMSMEHETTPEEIEAILASNQKFANGGTAENPVSSALCRRWQDARADGQRPADLARESGYYQWTVSHHANDRCSHEHGDDR